MTARKRFACVVAALLVTAGAVQVAQAERLRIAYSIWVGNGPLFVAQEKGFFRDEGVEVELIHMEYTIGATAALFGGQIDAQSASLDSKVAQFEENEEPLVCVLVFDESLGGDGIVANKGIKTIADLKGKKVAAQGRGVAQFFLNVLLGEAGLSEADIETVDLPFSDSGEAFLLQEVDAAVTGEPWLTEGKNSEHGHVLADSSDHPGLIVDCLITSARMFDERKTEFQAVARAWASAVSYVEAHPDEANEIMARNVGGWLEDLAVFAETLTGVRFYGEARNKEYFGTREQPGQIYDTAQKAIDVWSSLGVLKAKVSPADFIAHGIWDE